MSSNLENFSSFFKPPFYKDLDQETWATRILLTCRTKTFDIPVNTKFFSKLYGLSHSFITSCTVSSKLSFILFQSIGFKRSKLVKSRKNVSILSKDCKCRKLTEKLPKIDRKLTENWPKIGQWNKQMLQIRKK